MSINRDRWLEVGLFCLVLAVGLGLRTVRLSEVPPGLTHDEAGHTVDAIGVVEGVRPLYFTVGYGREPLYDYTTALTMLVIGKHYLASRVTAALFSTLLLVMLYAWTRYATGDRWLALAAMAALAVSFWGVSTGRQALRSVTLPALYMAAALALWRGIGLDTPSSSILKERLLASKGSQTRAAPPFRLAIAHIGWFALAGALVGVLFYTYLAARVMWAVFPAFGLALLVIHPRLSPVRLLPGFAVMLALAATIAAPLFLYLRQNPEAEIRLSQLSYPLEQAQAGDVDPLLGNIGQGLAMVSFYGDDLWLYNIPGRPLLSPALSVLFVVGLVAGVAGLFRRLALPGGENASTLPEAIAHLFMLLTLAAGLAPALIVGAGASNVRVIGAQPALYYFIGLGAVATIRWGERWEVPESARAVWPAYVIMIGATLAGTISAYFGVWANARDVRVAYHTTLAEALHLLDVRSELGPDVGFSTIYPGRFHDPAVARAALRRHDLQIRWYNADHACVLPAGGHSVYLSSALTTAPDGYWLPCAYPATSMFRERIALHRSDFNPVIYLSGVDHTAWQQRVAPAGQAALAVWGGALDLMSYSSEVIPTGEDDDPPGFVVETVWRLGKPSVATDLVLFTHAVNADGQVVAQQDRLDVSLWSLQPGDLFLQTHRISLPVGEDPARLRLLVGIYDPATGRRLPAAFADGASLGDTFLIRAVAADG